MQIKARIPADFYITGPKGKDLKLNTSFYYRKLWCRITIIGDDTFGVEDAESEEFTVMHAGGLDIILEENKENGYLKRIIETNEYDELVSIITKVVNHCIEAIRNFGMVPHIHEILEDYPRAECIIFFWSVQINDSGDNWTPIIVNPRNFEQLKHYYSYKQPPTGKLDAGRWPEIEKALKDDLNPPPEREFITNSIENLRIKNYRLALLEAIIGLEITLTRYLTEYLQNQKGLSKTRIKDLISPNLDLTARVSVLLDLIIEPQYLKNVDLEKILAAINWRNTVIHKTGNIPSGITAKALNESINEVLNLTTLLGSLYEKNIIE